MTFNVPADSYTQFMGRFSGPLADEFLELTAPTSGRRVVDVGCGPGALTTRLVQRLGSAAIAAADPSAPFVAAARAALPDVDIREASAEQLPWPDDSFDLALAQLVVHFMADAVAGLREMARVTRPEGLVAANVWDYGGDRSPLSPFWMAVREIDPAHPGEANLAGAVDGALVSLFEAAGLRDVRQHELSVRVPLSGFEEYWSPFELGVGPAGSYVRGLDGEAKQDLRRRVASRLPDGAFELHATAWAATGRCATSSGS